MKTAKEEAEQLIAQMMACTCPTGKYLMSYDLAKSCARKSVENAIKDYEHNMSVFTGYEALFLGQLQWYQSVLLNIKQHVYQQ